jgi:hypothetical protein
MKVDRENRQNGNEKGSQENGKESTGEEEVTTLANTLRGTPKASPSMHLTR